MTGALTGLLHNQKRHLTHFPSEEYQCIMSELKKKDSNDPVEVAMDYGVCGVENGSSISYKRVMWLVIKKS